MPNLISIKIQESSKSPMNDKDCKIYRQNYYVNILLVEDDPSVAASVIDGLKSEGFTVSHVDTGLKAIAHSSSSTPDIVLLDLGLPDLDGQEVCLRLRESSKVPIIILSARSEEPDRIQALRAGADDYLVKPFGMGELVARIEAVMRRSGAVEIKNSVLEIGALKIDQRTQRVFINEHEVQLTPKEFDLLSYLARDPGAVLRRSDIMRDVWDTDWFQTTKTVDAHIASLRKKLDHQEWIEAVRGVGFRLAINPQ